LMRDEITTDRISDIIQHKQPIVLFSGGKDSLATLSYVKELADEVDVDTLALHVWTGVTLPGVEDYIRRVCRQLRVGLVVIRPKTDFWEFARDVGFPSRTWRWCCRQLKVEPLKDYLRACREPKIIFDGRRKAEWTRRKKTRNYGWDRVTRCWWISPIFFWSDSRVQAYLMERDLPISPVYRVLNCSGECICGAFAHKRSFMKLRANYPEFFERLVQLEAERRVGYTFLFDGNKRTPLRELKKQRTLMEGKQNE